MPDLQKIFLSFIIGGSVCIIAQLLIDLTKLTPARILVLYVTLGVFLYSIGIYEPLFNACGAGISVPIIGFGASVASGVKEAVDSEGALGILKGPFTACSMGLSAALIFGYLAALLSKGRPKRS